MRAAQILAPLLFGALGACGDASSATTTQGQGEGTCSASSTFAAAPLATIAGDKGKLQVAIHTTPNQSLIAADQCLELVVTDTSSGASVDGLTVTMTPWMPAMGHGASVTPTVSALGAGRYVFTNVSLFMPGEWELRTQFSGELTDSVEPTFYVD